MEPFFDRTGKVHSWIDFERGRIVDLWGRHVALISSNAIFDWEGRQIGWWHGDHARNLSGQVAGFLRGATALGPVMPTLAPVPVKPPLLATPPRPVLAMRRIRPSRATSWAPTVPF